MIASELELPPVDVAPIPGVSRTALRSRPEPGPTENWSANPGLQLGAAQGSTVSSAGEFSRAESRVLQGDDAMAAGMIGAILGIAFLVLLGLTVGVTVWTMSVAS